MWIRPLIVVGIKGYPPEWKLLKSHGYQPALVLTTGNKLKACHIRVIIALISLLSLGKAGSLFLLLKLSLSSYGLPNFVLFFICCSTFYLQNNIADPVNIFQDQVSI